jgi:hypothetical protein
MTDHNRGGDDDEGDDIRRRADEQLRRLEPAKATDQLIGELVLFGIELLKSSVRLL